MSGRGMSGEGRYVYRDGGLWLLPPDWSDLGTAVDRAVEYWSRGLPSGVTPAQRIADADPPDGYHEAIMLRHAMEGLRSDPVGVLVVYRTDDDRLVVTPLERTRFRAALTMAIGCVGAVALAEAVKHQPLGVSTYKSGKRRGQPRFTRDHSPAFRRRVLEIAAANERAEQARDDANTCLHSTLSVLVGPLVAAATSAPTSVAECNHRLQLLRWLEPGIPWTRDDAKTWLAEQRRQLGDARRALASIDAHGFGPGTRCTVEPDPDALPDELQPTGLCTITGAHVELYRSYGEDGEHHTRSLVDGAGREWEGVALRKLKSAQ